MSYLPLARKYRPNTFAQLIGQEGTALALANAIRLGREPHAIIFSGVRGIGKTTTARLYAKALNCDRGPIPEPCNECESCRAVTLGFHEDVLEIDGASNTGVDDVRQLRDTIDYVPRRSKFKIYIIDEVHMLSQSAFNALLKTLEEPPAHVVFVFATTELQKVPQTILSRCQTFYLSKLSLSAIQKQLSEILEAESVSYEAKAVHVVAREAKGSMRDGLTLLDQAIALGNGSVTIAALAKIVMDLASEPYLRLLEALLARQAGSALSVIDQVDRAGIEYDRFCENLAKLSRHAMIIQKLGKESLDVASLGLDEHEIDDLAKLAVSAKEFDLNRLFRSLVKCSGEMTGGGLDRFVLENYVFEWCFDPGLPSFAISGLTQVEAGHASTKTSGPKPDSKPGSYAAPSVISTAPPNPVVGMPQAPLRADAPPPPKATEISVAAFRSQLNATPEEKKNLGQPEPTAPIVPPEARAEPIQVGGEAQFPDDWASLIALWKKEKPFQARKLEEVHPLHYGAERIRIAVCGQGYASHTLLRSDEQLRLKEQFAELFGFGGLLEVVEKDGEAVPESLLQKIERETSARRDQIVAAARDAAMTKRALEVFGGRIDDVTLTGDESS